MEPQVINFKMGAMLPRGRDGAKNVVFNVCISMWEVRLYALEPRPLWLNLLSGGAWLLCRVVMVRFLCYSRNRDRLMTCCDAVSETWLQLNTHLIQYSRVPRFLGFMALAKGNESLNSSPAIGLYPIDLGLPAPEIPDVGIIQILLTMILLGLQNYVNKLGTLFSLVWINISIAAPKRQRQLPISQFRF